MAVRIPWSDQEAALLLHALIDVLQHNTNRKSAISEVSKELRQLAIRNGIDIDEKFRNENGVSLQMSCLEYVFTEGASGLSVKTGWYFRIVELYKNQPEQFETLLKEVTDMVGNTGKSTQDQYFSWLSKRVSPAQLSELYLVYDEIDKYFIGKKVLKASLFQTTDIKVLLTIRNTIESNKIFRITHRRNLSKMSSAVRQYISFIKEDKGEILSVQPPIEEKNRQSSTALTEALQPQPTVEVTALAQATVPAETDEDVSATHTEQILDCSDIISSLRSNQIEFVDNRSKGGCLWIFGGSELKPFAISCEQIGIKFNYKPEGSHSTHGKPGWWTKAGTDRLPAVQVEEQAGQMELFSAENTDETETVDLSEDRVYAFTTPISYSYFGEKSPVSSWREVYTNFIAVLLDDYPAVVLGVRGSAIMGRGRIDVSDAASSSLMASPKKISDDVYVETNYSATDLMKRLRQLIILCNVDFENFQITFKHQSSSGQPPTTSTKATTLHVDNGSDSPAGFMNWMLANGMAKGTTNGYTSSLRQVAEFAKRKGYFDGNVFSITSVPELKKLQAMLDADNEFVTYNTEQHHRFGAAFRKYTEYRMAGSEDSTEPTQQLRLEQVETVSRNATSSVSPDVAENYTALLRDEFPDGLRQNIIHVKKFIQRYEERFGSIDATRDNLLDQLRQIGVIRDDRIYPRQDSGQKSLTDEIYEAVRDVFQNGGTCVYLSMIMERFGQRLGEQMSIYNEDALQAILLERNPSMFLFRYGYICEDAAKADSSYDVLHFMKSHHKPVTYDEIQSVLWYLPLDKIKHALVTTPSLVNVEQETYFYAPNLPINANELQTLICVMDEEISTEGFLVGKDLKGLIDKYCPSAAIDLVDMKDWAIRNCLSYILRDNFEFTGALISQKGHAISTGEAYRDFCQQHEKLTLNQLKEFSAEINLSIYWDDVLAVMVRTSATEMRRADGIHFDIDETDAVLDTLCAGDYIPIREIRLYLQFPSIEVPWNGFVLESYLKSYSKRFQLFQVSVLDSEYYGVVVRRASALQNYEQVVIDLLARSTEWKNQSEALELLVDRGLQARRRYSNFTAVVKKALLLREEIENEKK